MKSPELTKKTHMVEGKKRIRRTNIAIERDIMTTISKIVKEEGFSKLNLSYLSEKANVRVSVIERHFGSMEALLELYTQKHDYWLNDAVDVDNVAEKETLNNVATRFVDALWTNKELQQLMIWELIENNRITRKSAQRRELTILNIMPKYEAVINNPDANPKAVLAIIIAGIYHLILRKDRSTFCGVDFKSKKGKQELITAVSSIFSGLGELSKKNSLELSIAKKLKENGVSVDIIAESTSLTKKQIEKL